MKSRVQLWSHVQIGLLIVNQLTHQHAVLVIIVVSILVVTNIRHFRITIRPNDPSQNTRDVARIFGLGRG